MHSVSCFYAYIMIANYKYKEIKQMELTLDVFSHRMLWKWATPGLKTDHWPITFKHKKSTVYVCFFLFCFLSVVFLNDLYFSFIREKVKACFSVMLWLLCFHSNPLWWDTKGEIVPLSQTLYKENFHRADLWKTQVHSYGFHRNWKD